MKTRLVFSVWFMATLLLIVTDSMAFAGFIQLKDGTVIETAGTWEDGGKVCGFVDGQIKTFPKEEVAHWNDADTAKPQPKSEPDSKPQDVKPKQRASSIETKERAEGSRRPSSKSTPASGRAFTQSNAIACMSEEALDDMIRFVAANDKTSFQSYIDRQKCIICKEGLEVTVIEYPSMFGGKAQFAYKGFKFWTTREGLRYH